MIIEDGKSQREMLKNFLLREGHGADEAASGEEGLAKINRGHYDLLLLDYKMPGMDGMEVLKEVKKLNPEIDVVIITAYGTVESAVEAMKAGALDYITKPIEFDDLLFLIGRVAERRILIKENELLRKELAQKGISTDDIVYISEKMESLVNMAGRVAPSRANVLIYGESGTGKELFARLIHHLSPRAKRPMVVVNCGVLQENLLESELFGHEKGAYTGASSKRTGKAEEAEGGTLFLDEIGDIPPGIQVKLLRFLQEREFQRLGGNQTLQADVRVIAATNRDLEVRVKEGTFREDLFYRLNVINLKLPPLRERKEDLRGLINHFLGSYARENRKNLKGITSEAFDLLMKYDYPGNVRELENIVERAVVIARDEVITTSDLPFGNRFPSGSDEPQPASLQVSLREAMEDLERRLIAAALENAGHHQSRAAEVLGISERMLRYKIKKYGFKN
jgi:two-component system NtrC family response regulator